MRKLFEIANLSRDLGDGEFGGVELGVNKLSRVSRKEFRGDCSIDELSTLI